MQLSIIYCIHSAIANGVAAPVPARGAGAGVDRLRLVAAVGVQVAAKDGSEAALLV